MEITIVICSTPQNYNCMMLIWLSKFPALSAFRALRDQTAPIGLKWMPFPTQDVSLLSISDMLTPSHIRASRSHSGVNLFRAICSRTFGNTYLIVLIFPREGKQHVIINLVIIPVSPGSRDFCVLLPLFSFGALWLSLQKDGLSFAINPFSGSRPI